VLAFLAFAGFIFSRRHRLPAFWYTLKTACRRRILTINLPFMGYLKLIVVLAGTVALGYFKRHGFRRAWYVLRTGAENPDWEKLARSISWGARRRETRFRAGEL